IQVALLDSNQKKAAFLRQAVADLQLKNATVVCERLEAWHAGEKFDLIISRAFAEIAEFIALTTHLLAPRGVFAAMKGIYPFEEIEHLPPGFRVQQVHSVAVPGLEAERHLVLIERARPASSPSPIRRAGLERPRPVSMSRQVSLSPGCASCWWIWIPRATRLWAAASTSARSGLRSTKCCLDWPPPIRRGRSRNQAGTI